MAAPGSPKRVLVRYPWLPIRTSSTNEWSSRNGIPRLPRGRLLKLEFSRPIATVMAITVCILTVTTSYAPQAIASYPLCVLLASAFLPLSA